MINDYQNQLADFYLNIHEKMRHEGDRLSDYIDKVIVWVVSLSTASIALIISFLNNEYSFIHKEKINNTLIILLSSILCGVFARVIDGVTSYMSMMTNATFLASLYNAKIPYKPSKLNGEETIDDIIRYIKEDFNQDAPALLIKICSKEPIDSKKDELARNFYDAYVEESQIVYEKALNRINTEVNNSLGITREKKANIDINVKNLRLAKRKRILQKIYFGLAFLSLVSFTTSVFYIAIAFIQTNK